MRSKCSFMCMCKSHCEQPADHQVVVVVDNRIGTLHKKQPLLFIVHIHLSRSNVCLTKNTTDLADFLLCFD